MHKYWNIPALALCLLLFTGQAGCAKKNVRHLASDVCLISPEVTTREQVLTYLGPPDEQLEMAEGGETWIYYEARKSTLRETPYIGEKLGDEEYETVRVTFAGDTVRTCVYRLLSEEEFMQGGAGR